MTRLIRRPLACGAMATGVAAFLAFAPPAAADEEANPEETVEGEAVEGETVEGEELEEPTYTVIDGMADPATVEGYRVYTAQCMPCHGPDGLGSTFAPSLVRAAERRTFEEFMETVREGRSIMPGQVMPPFGDNPEVMAHVDDIWRYLTARADGVLERGRPLLLTEDVEEDEEETGS